MNIIIKTGGYLLASLVLATTLAYHAKAQLSLDGEYRTRTELNRGLGNLPDEASDAILYTSQRTRLNLNYEYEDLTTALSIQDVRTWGGESIYSGTGVWGDSTGLDIHKAWFEYQFTDRFALKVGRQVFNYDDGRILSWRNWNQYGLSYDAALFKFEPENWKVHLGLSYNSRANPRFGDDRYYNDGNRFKTFNFLYAKHGVSNSLDVSFQAYAASYQGVFDSYDVNTMYTFGTYLDYNEGPLTLEGSLYGQTGTNETGQDIMAYMFTADGSYNTGVARFSGGLAYISGSDPESSDYGAEDHTFDLMYGARHGYYGWMNHFTLIDRHTNNAGLIDVHPGVAYSFNSKSSLKLTYNMFWLANDVAVDDQIISDRSLGSELDASFNYRLTDYANITAGLSWFEASGTMERLRGLRPGDSAATYWGWLMLQFKPTFFES